MVYSREIQPRVQFRPPPIYVSTFVCIAHCPLPDDPLYVSRFNCTLPSCNHTSHYPMPVVIRNFPLPYGYYTRPTTKLRPRTSLRKLLLILGNVNIVSLLLSAFPVTTRLSTKYASLTAHLSIFKLPTFGPPSNFPTPTTHIPTAHQLPIVQ